ncbi:hypothetical protein HYH02_007491 [Chlamydomonas schloesseri]|uniref:Uncharacterized protein n=1 Tax=Chlamydomonas schloesseri TaxID=2026947 RepID=A0A835WHD5_9CHLO|nr:hypothetical protein HYH02_007491 [Chlamydomonas schloesseri]|eukprot:KAG2447568.1 hypothetical protein HYH02_007491 [Chlamydomonas schloesseri]
MRPDGPPGGRRPDVIDLGDLAQSIDSDDERFMPLRTSKSRRNATALYAPSLDAPDPSEAAAAAAAVAAMPSVAPAGPFDPASAALKPRRNAYAMYISDGAQQHVSGGSSSGGSGDTAALTAGALAGGGGVQGGDDGRTGSRSAPLLQMAAAVLGGGTLAIADGDGVAPHGKSVGGVASGQLWSSADASPLSQQQRQAATSNGMQQQTLSSAVVHSQNTPSGIAAVGDGNHGTSGHNARQQQQQQQQQQQEQTTSDSGTAGVRLHDALSQSLPDAAARMVAGLQLPAVEVPAAHAAAAAAGGQLSPAAAGPAATAAGMEASTAAPWGRRAGSEPAWHEGDAPMDAAAASAPDNAEATAAKAVTGMDYTLETHAASAPLPVLMEGGVPLTLPPPVSVQVSSRSRKTVDTSGKGKLTMGVVGVFHPQLYMKGGDCIEVDGKMISRGRFEKLAGTATAKWHVSIKVLPSGTTIGKWLQQHGLPVLQGRPRKRRAASPLHDEDTDEPDEDLPEDDGSGDDDENNGGSNRSSRRASRRDHGGSTGAAGAAGGAAATAGGSSRMFNAGLMQPIPAGGIGQGGTVALPPVGAASGSPHAQQQQQQQQGGGSNTPSHRLSVPGVSGSGGSGAFARHSADPRMTSSLQQPQSAAVPAGTITSSQGLVDVRQQQVQQLQLQQPAGLPASMFAAGVKLGSSTLDAADDDLILSLLDTAVDTVGGDDALPPPESGDLLVSAASQLASGAGFAGGAAVPAAYAARQQAQQHQNSFESAPQQDAAAQQQQQQRMLLGLRGGALLSYAQQQQLLLQRFQQRQQQEQQPHNSPMLHPLLRGDAAAGSTGAAAIGAVGGSSGGQLRSFDGAQAGSDMTLSDLGGMYGGLSGFGGNTQQGSGGQQWAFSAPGQPVSANNARAFLLRQQLMQQQQQRNPHQPMQQMPALGGLSLQHQQSLGLQTQSSGGYAPLQHARSGPVGGVVAGGGSPALPTSLLHQATPGGAAGGSVAGLQVGTAVTSSLPAPGSTRSWGQVGAATFEAMMAGGGQAGGQAGGNLSGLLAQGSNVGGASGMPFAAAAFGASMLGGGGTPSGCWGRAGSSTAGAAAAGAGAGGGGGAISGMFGFADGGSAATSSAGTAGRALAACGSMYTSATGGLTSTTTLGGYSEDAFNRRSSILSNTPLELPSPPPPLGLQDVEMLVAVAQRINFAAGSGGNSLSSDLNATAAAGGGGGGGAGGRMFAGGVVQTVRPQLLHTSASGGYSGGASVLGVASGAGSGPLPTLLPVGGGGPLLHAAAVSMPQHDEDFSQQLQRQHDLIRPAKGRRLGEFLDSADPVAAGMVVGPAGASAAYGGSSGSGLTLAGAGNLGQGQLQQLPLQMQQIQQQQQQQVGNKRESSSVAMALGSGSSAWSNDGSSGYGGGTQQAFAAMRSLEERAAALMRPRVAQGAAAVPNGAGAVDALLYQQQ